MPRDGRGKVHQGVNLESVFAALEPFCKALDQFSHPLCKTVHHAHSNNESNSLAAFS